MNFYRNLGNILFILLFLGFISPALAQSRIVAVVNDDLITSVDIKEGIKAKLARSKEMRQALVKRFRSPSTKRRWKQMVQAERPTSQAEAKRLQGKLVRQIRRELSRQFSSRFRKTVLGDLIDERIKYQAAKKNSMLLSEEETNKLFKRMASRNKNPKTGKPLTLKQFQKALKSQGVNFRKLKQRVRIQNSWQRYVYSKFGHQVSVSEKQVEQALARKKTPKPAAQKASKQKVIKVSFVVSRSAPESRRTRRYDEAVRFRKSVTSCSKIAQQAALQSNVKIKYISNGLRYAKIRTAVRQLAMGQLSVPVLFDDFIAIYAKCGGSTKKVVATRGVNDEERKKVKSRLKQKAIFRLGKRHLRDLKQDANIEYR